MPAMRRHGTSGRRLKEIGRDSLHRLTDNFKLADHRVLPVRLGHELFVPNLDVALDLPDGVEHVLEVEVAPAHSGTASERTRSRR
jgi:hypothetical protein